MKDSSYNLPLKTGLDLTALVDVVFLLLAYFLINATLLTTASINVELPGSTSSVVNKNISIILEIDQNNSLKVDGKTIKIELLAQKIKMIHTSNAKAEFTIRAHKRSSAQDLISIMDILKNEGIENIFLDTVKIRESKK